MDRNVKSFSNKTIRFFFHFFHVKATDKTEYLCVQIFNFCIVGVIATLIDFIFMYIFKDICHFSLILANTLSFVISVMYNYWVSVTFVFHIDEGKNPEFAIALFDINNLKYVNDTYGHKAGDDYIKKGCKIICQTFKRSPVFRVGGDEFVAILQDEDLTDRENIINEFRRENEKRVDDGDIVIASGIAVYNGDTNVSAVFEKADAEMYKNKKQLKGR